MNEAEKLAQACDEVITASAQALVKASLRIGWYGMLMREKGLFRVLGFESEEAYYRSRGIGRSTWYRAVAIAENLKHLGRDAVLSMKVENARMLACCSDDVKHDGEIAKLAASRPVKDFASSLRTIASKSSFGAINARNLYFSVDCNADQLKEIKRLLSAFGPVSSGTLIHALRLASLADVEKCA